MHHLLGARDPTARLHHQERLVVETRAKLIRHARQIAGHVRLDERIDQRRHRALVLAIFRQHVAGERKHRLGIFLGHDLGDAALVRRIGVGVDQTNADRAHALAAEERGGGARARLVERAQFLALVIEPAADLAHEPQRHDAVRLHPEVGVAIALGHRLTGDLQDMPEALGDDQPERVDLALQERVGGDRGAMGEARDCLRSRLGVIQDLFDPAHQSDSRIGRRARHLGDPHGAGAGIDRNDIGERAAGVDADAQAGRGRSQRHTGEDRPRRRGNVKDR